MRQTPIKIGTLEPGPPLETFTLPQMLTEMGPEMFETTLNPTIEDIDGGREYEVGIFIQSMYCCNKKFRKPPHMYQQWRL